MKEIHDGADFLLGVIVGLAIEKAIEGFLHGLNHAWLVDAGHVAAVGESAPLSQKLLELARVVVFMVMIVRFYFGWIYHSHKVHLDLGRTNPVAIAPISLARCFTSHCSTRGA